MSDEPTPDGQAPTPATATDADTSDEPAPIEPTTGDPPTVSRRPASQPTLEPVTAEAKAPPPRSIARDIVLVAVVFVAVFILLGGLLWLAVPSGDRGATRPSPTSTLRSAAEPTPVPAASSSGSVTGAVPSVSGSPGPTSADPSADPVLVGAGDIADCGLDADAATASLLDGIDGTVFTAGDNAYPDGTPEQFRTCYGSTWGRQLARTRPAPGNHDWGTKDLAGYLGYFGAAAAPAGKSWYSYDLGAWHVIVLDSDCTSVGGCGAATDQGRWLAADLAASTAGCTLAIWHHPRFSSGEHGNDPSVAPFWTALYDAGADVVVNGHDHDYERFAAQDPDGRPDAARGLREFVVGTGGAALRSFPSARRPTASSATTPTTASSGSCSTRRPTTGRSCRPAAVRQTRGTGPATDVSCPSMSTDQARVVVIGGGITGCSVAYHLALAGWTDVLLVEKAQLTAGSTCQAAGLVTAFNPSSTMMAFRRYSIELYGRLGAFEAVGSLRLASSPDQLRELERTASRARGIGLEAEVIGADEARRLMPAISPDALYGAVHLASDGYLDPAWRHPRGRRCRASPRRSHPDGPAGDGLRAVGPARGHGRPDRGRPDRHRDRRQCGRDVGAAGGGDGRSLHPVDAGRPPARRAEGRPGPRAAPRHALLPRPGQPRVRQERAGRHGLRRLRDGPGLALGGRRAMGPRRALAATRLGTVRAVDGRRHPALPVPRRRRGDPARLPSGRDDARRQPAVGAAPRCPRASGSPRACRSTGSAAVAGSAGRWRAGSRPATRASTSGRTAPGASARSTATRGSRPAWRARRTRTTTGCATRSMPTSPAGRDACPRSMAGSRRPARSSAPRPAGSAPTITSRAGRGAGPDATRPPTAGPSRPGSSASAPRRRAVRERAGIVDLSSFGKIAVEGPGALAAAPASERQRHRSPGRQPRSTRSGATSAAGSSPT